MNFASFFGQRENIPCNLIIKYVNQISNLSCPVFPLVTSVVIKMKAGDKSVLHFSDVFESGKRLKTSVPWGFHAADCLRYSSL